MFRRTICAANKASATRRFYKSVLALNTLPVYMRVVSKSSMTPAIITL